ncbi:hypothetical protein ACO2XV_20750 [Escherichia coli]
MALPAVRAKTAEHPETLVASRQFCRQPFLSTDGATSLEAGSHYRRSANAVLHAGNAPAGETLFGARTVLHIQDYEVDAMLGLGLAGKGKGGKVGAAWQRRSSVADCITSITSPRFRVR